MSFVVRNDRMFSAFIVAVVVVVALSSARIAYMGDDDVDDVEDNSTTMQSIIHLEEQKRAFLCEHGHGRPRHLTMSRHPSNAIYVYFFLRFIFFCFAPLRCFLCSAAQKLITAAATALLLICNATRFHFIIIICSESN